LGTRYSKTLSVAFWQTYLQDQTDYLPYLTASYLAASVGQPMRLDIIRSLTPAQLEAAYGRTPPIPIIPPPVAAVPPARDESILVEIERTGVLKVAFRKDAPPFGYINAENAWAGYCGDVAIALGEHLTSTLNDPVGIELVELTSTLQNRFDLVRDGSVHLECGPNTIRQDIPGITFSIPFYVTGAKFLVRQAQAATVNFNLPGLRLGVLQDTTTAAFVRECYPNADIVTFAGANDREQAVQAVVSGAIEAFIGDSVLSEAELQRQNLPRDQFALLPENPLTCEYYGLILPDNDPQWRQAVNEFLQNTEVIQADFDQDLRELDYCFNR
jgi:ABC-type amino acid transport substrate-binding protein